MNTEFAAFDAAGQVVETIDPVLSYRQLDEQTYRVDNGYGEYDVTIPDGGRFEVRVMQDQR